MKETQEILKQMGFDNPNDNVWKSEWFGYFILAKEATPQQLALFIFDRGYNKGLKDTPNNLIPTSGKAQIEQGKEEKCNCAIPYFPTGDIKNCSRCGKPTVY